MSKNKLAPEATPTPMTRNHSLVPLSGTTPIALKTESTIFELAIAINTDLLVHNTVRDLAFLPLLNRCT